MCRVLMCRMCALHTVYQYSINPCDTLTRDTLNSIESTHATHEHATHSTVLNAHIKHIQYCLAVLNQQMRHSNMRHIKQYLFNVSHMSLVCIFFFVNATHLILSIAGVSHVYIHAHYKLSISLPIDQTQKKKSHRGYENGI